MTAPATPFEPNADRDLHFEVEQFYFHEARLLDGRQFKQWMTLVTPDIAYTVPVRHTALPDPAARGEEGMYDPERELSHDLEPPHRSENLLTLSLRVDRLFKVNAWAENPPPRTRRMVSNVSVEVGEGSHELSVLSNFILVFSRHGQDNHIYSGQRRDRLRRVEGALRIARREVILDWNVVTGPSLGLFF